MKFLPALLTLATVATAAPVDFVREVQPILKEHCYSCHGEEKQKSGLRLDIKAEALKGGEAHAPNIRPGKSAESPLVQFVTGEDEDMLMPPKGKRLSGEEVATLRRWIDEGAVWPDGVDASKVADKRDWWSFKPLAVASKSGSLDALVGVKLQEKGLAMSPEADRRTLIRRLYFVLHGLPPTPEEVEAFAADSDPRAYEKLVDRLLASPRYGERWARHWLDIIAFGETHGFEVNTPRDNAWPYRDYVINAWNKDTPYPRFILEQLAGDSVGVDAATGFIVASAALRPGQIGKDEESKAKARQDELADMVSIVGGAFLGLTLHCARCHDHKFDPVSQSDYYGLQAIFAGVRHGERPMAAPGEKPKQAAQSDLLPKLAAATHRLLHFEPLAESGVSRVPVHAHRNTDRFAPIETRRIRFTILATAENNRYEPCLDELEVYSVEGRNVALAGTGVKARASSSRGDSKHRLEHLNDGRYGNERSWISTTKGTGWVEVEWTNPERIEAVVWGRDRLDKYPDRLAVEYRVEAARADGSWQTVATGADRRPYRDAKQKREEPEPSGVMGEEITQWHEARGAVQALEGQLRASVAGPMVYAGTFEEPGPSFRLHRGEAAQPREPVTPGAVSALGASLRLPAATPEQQRRIALAKWLADPANPLPARVLVNRLWQHHFGEGLVATPNDFGRNGAQPTNPALLDWLAAEFIRGGWSIKTMQRLIVTSAAWKQSSAPRPDGLAADAQGRLLWRFPPRRLEAESVRDEILAVSGSLDLRMGGPGFSVFAPNTNYVRVYDPKPEFGPAEWRRMIYVTKVRVAQDATFGSFDCPDAGQSQPVRARSTTALQALSLFNSGFVNQQAEILAARLTREAGDDLAKQTQRAFALTVQRAPTIEEAQVCALLAQEHGLPMLCRVLFNANEFLFLP
jgi:mono/diheme cytochrome c family protein